MICKPAAELGVHPLLQWAHKAGCARPPGECPQHLGPHAKALALPVFIEHINQSTLPIKTWSLCQAKDLAPSTCLSEAC